jgi:hypothetical protein
MADMPTIGPTVGPTQNSPSSMGMMSTDEAQQAMANYAKALQASNLQAQKQTYTSPWQAVAQGANGLQSGLANAMKARMAQQYRNQQLPTGGVPQGAGQMPMGAPGTPNMAPPTATGGVPPTGAIPNSSGGIPPQAMPWKPPTQGAV